MTQGCDSDSKSIFVNSIEENPTLTKQHQDGPDAVDIYSILTAYLRIIVQKLLFTISKISYLRPITSPKGINRATVNHPLLTKHIKVVFLTLWVVHAVPNVHLLYLQIHSCDST